MKNWIIIFAVMLGSVHLSAQNWCDSTLTVCDSISLDSIFFTHAFGDRMHVSMTNHHVYLYAPTFVLCPDNDALDLDKNYYGYFSLFGPTAIMPFYDFLNFDLIGDSLEGSIILDNTNNGSLSCRVEFHTPVSSNTTGSAVAYADEDFIFPNPAKDFLYFKNPNFNQIIRKISMVNILGDAKMLNMTSGKIDLSQNPPGMYVLLMEMQDGSMLSKKIIISASNQ